MPHNIWITRQRKTSQDRDLEGRGRVSAPGGRRKEPPANSSAKNRKVKPWYFYSTKFTPIFKTNEGANAERVVALTKIVRSDCVVKRMGAPRLLPAVAGAKTKNFPYLSSFFRRGCGGSRQKMKKNFLVLLRRFIPPERTC